MEKITESKFTKWVSTWGTATSISERREAVYSKDVTFRYPIHICFDASKIRIRFSNLTGTEEVVINKIFADKVPVTFGGKTELHIPAGKEITSDEIEFAASRNQTVSVSFYLKDFTQMNAGTLVTGPLSGGTYAYGDFSLADEFPADLSRSTSIIYFLNTVDVFTEEQNHAICCYGDSITAQDWPDFLQMELEKKGVHNASVIRRAVCGTRILRQYDCITYQSYGLKGKTRFPIELNVAGLDTVIIQHGINDIIHPVGIETNRFRPMSDLPTCEEMISGVKEFYLSYCKEHGLKVFSGTLLPIGGWRTYATFREELRNEFNNWLRTSSDFDGCIDFDKALCDSSDSAKMKSDFDSGDHLHPSKAGYERMAQEAAKII